LRGLHGDANRQKYIAAGNQLAKPLVGEPAAQNGFRSGAPPAEQFARRFFTLARIAGG
jgi:hypothetical protein